MTKTTARRIASISVLATLALLAALSSWLFARPYAAFEVDAVERTELGATERTPLRAERVAGPAAPRPRSAPPLPSAAHGAENNDKTAEKPSMPPAVPRPTPALTDTENYLLVGLDRHPGVKRGGSTDSLLVVVFDKSSRHVGVVSVPRDLYVEAEGHGMTRINGVYGLAGMAGKNPLEALERVIEDTLALPIAHSLAIDLGVFERLVDAVGGVEVDVPCAIKDNFVDPRTPTGRRALELTTGVQHLDGPTAAMFVRSRHGRSDFSRARRQQLVLLGLRQKVASTDGIARLPELLGHVEASLVTNMRRYELLGLARRVLGVDPSHLHGVVLGNPETTPHRTEENWSVLLPDHAAIQATLSKLFSAPSPGTHPASVPCPAADVAIRRTYGAPLRAGGASRTRGAGEASLAAETSRDAVTGGATHE